METEILKELLRIQKDSNEKLGMLNTEIAVLNVKLETHCKNHDTNRGTAKYLITSFIAVAAVAIATIGIFI